MEEVLVEVDLDSSNLIKYYSNLGYKIPKINGRTPLGTKILVRDKDVFEKRLIGNRYGKLVVIDFDKKERKIRIKRKNILDSGFVNVIVEI